ncbi:rfaE bifunctional protein kinase chain/domain/rfaE bifunctional protein nucleotidyltransferase chain/domain [Kribbella sp. VKM Ac-2527]|jgi:D-beta-D-heptose 7-phosphate kinase/D-beta-D-heptose 1-phosphate adenosyltransferase|uniref:RfaE bifunctional protein kinase chain/domain/rfaE bifunctional protein nucleotidyltransferase chain/domain n=1 Tax=Kribbella caucasensis TaxID=2512215 RepID=A0A4R6KCU2_9ACTN|nr:PfkB family carbohydrate kinase [Kribbella sp. VKM Ac-2527]TDO47973.1 rfaE bifunctional protein kinase chain/domain/rfaE bifunctional protein nucleotidyltransferase chain/domain [Kribbella sp. VKM Ac-2527]
MTIRVLVVGDVMLDRDIEGDVHRVSPDAPVPVVQVEGTSERAGGAGLAAVLLAREGVEVRLATALADDEPAKRLAALLTERVPVTAILGSAGTRCKTRIRSAGQSLLRLDIETPDGFDDACDVAALEEELDQADAVLVSDYAGGVVSHPEVHRVLRRWAPQRAMVWDPHPRGAALVPGLTLATPNRAEARHFSGNPSAPLDVLAAELRDRWQAWAVAVTDGGAGVFTAAGGTPPFFAPAPFNHSGDACGAGDRFAGTAAVKLGAGATARSAIAAAVDDTASWLAAGGVSAKAVVGGAASGVDAAAVIRRVHAAGGTVVATGGCFDVLHAGHIASLEAARRLGDALIVLVNSDASVQRLKGADRPINPEQDRCRVLESLRCVDAAIVFGGNDPCELLDELRPDVWAKGGDYTEEMLPEAPVVRSWGGRVVLVPYLPGRSTTSILEGRT